jgi:hypothetical protein
MECNAFSATSSELLDFTFAGLFLYDSAFSWTKGTPQGLKGYCVRVSVCVCVCLCVCVSIHGLVPSAQEGEWNKHSEN